MQSCAEVSLANDTNIRMIALFDNEEVREFFFFYFKLPSSFMSKNSPQTHKEEAVVIILTGLFIMW